MKKQYRFKMKKTKIYHLYYYLRHLLTGRHLWTMFSHWECGQYQVTTIECRVCGKVQGPKDWRDSMKFRPRLK